jgi:hypothetical protein
MGADGTVRRPRQIESAATARLQNGGGAEDMRGLRALGEELTLETFQGRFKR